MGWGMELFMALSGGGVFLLGLAALVACWRLL